METAAEAGRRGRCEHAARERLAVPVRYALRRLRVNWPRTLIVALGIAVGAAVLAMTAVGSVAVQDRALQRALAQLQPSDRAIQAVWGGVPGQSNLTYAQLDRIARGAVAPILGQKPFGGALSREFGATTLVVSHDPSSASVADRVVQIRDGRVSAEDGAAVVNRGGWVRIPEELLGGASRAQVDRIPEGVVLRVREWAAAPERAQPEVARGDVVVRTVGLTRSYGDALVFHDLSLEFESGRLSAVTGRSGSGKSTLLHLIAGLDLPTAGEVHVLDAPISQLDATQRALVRRAHIGLVTQGSDLVPFLTAEESVELALAMHGAPTTGAAEALAAVGLEELAQQRVERLSMGERQRVAVARALAARPKLLLADEPTARLDEANARAVGALFAELAATTGAAIVCATHDPVLIEHARAEVPLGSLAANERRLDGARQGAEAPARPALERG